MCHSGRWVSNTNRVHSRQNPSPTLFSSSRLSETSMSLLCYVDLRSRSDLGTYIYYYMSSFSSVFALPLHQLLYNLKHDTILSLRSHRYVTFVP